MADRPDCPNCGGAGRELPDGNCGFDDPGALLDIECGRCGGTGRAADRPDHDLADALDRRATRNAITRSYNILPPSRPEDDDLDRAAAARLRQLSDRRTQLTGDTSVDIAIAYGYEVGVEDGRAEVLAERDEYRRQLDTILDAIEKLIPWAESYRMHHVAIALRGALAAAAAVPSGDDTGPTTGGTT